MEMSAAEWERIRLVLPRTIGGLDLSEKVSEEVYGRHPDATIEIGLTEFQANLVAGARDRLAIERVGDVR